MYISKLLIWGILVLKTWLVTNAVYLQQKQPQR